MPGIPCRLLPTSRPNDVAIAGNVGSRVCKVRPLLAALVNRVIIATQSRGFPPLADTLRILPLANPESLTHSLRMVIWGDS